MVGSYALFGVSIEAEPETRNFVKVACLGMIPGT